MPARCAPRLIIALATLLLLAPARAALPQTRPTTAPVNVSGSYTWDQMSRAGPMEVTLTLIQDGEKLTGSLNNPFGGQSDIEDGLVRGGNFSFRITNERGGDVVVTLYSGTLTGQVLKIRLEEVRVRTFEARRN